ncbi:MAG TPA: 2,3-bisphosphoglycerate-independent phosphoglycerate mutase [candidate division Zixibacteria bacterium]|nr:2,3-bisphosphoglycerate-independent phosphoglycerate mutase [candidate division Zixibacteria bacterium]
MVKRVVLLVCDGLADRPIKEFGYKSPLEAARTPHLDRLAKESVCGMVHTLGRGRVPGSDVAHLEIFGYPIEKYYAGRGPIEVCGLGMKLQGGDVALRGNFATVDKDWNIVDRRAGRINHVAPLCAAIDGIEIDGVKFLVHPGTGHRAGVIMRGEGLSDKIIDADPHGPGEPVRTVTATDASPEARRTAEVLNRFLRKSYEALGGLDLNRQRVKEGKLPANILLVRGAGQHIHAPSFSERYGLKACAIAGGGLYKGVGSFVGMDVVEVPGATGLPDTDIAAKFRAVLAKLAEYDFVFVHVKAADSLGEDGNAPGKKDFVEKIDAAAKILAEGLPEDVLLVATADHTTPCEMKAHAADPVPIMFRGNNVRVDGVAAFGERACAQGGLGFMLGREIMPQVVNFLGKGHLEGA